MQHPRRAGMSKNTPNEHDVVAFFLKKEGKMGVVVVQEADIVLWVCVVFVSCVYVVIA